jgi:hypothetical protein
MNRNTTNMLPDKARRAMQTKTGIVLTFGIKKLSPLGLVIGIVGSENIFLAKMNKALPNERL